MPDRPTDKHPGDGVALLIPAAVFAAVYALLPSARHHLDGIWNIAAMVEGAAGEPLGAFFRASEPSHLLYDVCAVIVWKAIVAVGFTGRALTALAFVTALVGALGLRVFAGTARRLTGSTTGAVICTLGLGASAAWWMYADNLEDILPSVVVFLVAFDRALATASSDSHRGWTAVGIWTAVAILLHQTTVVLLPALAVLGLLSGRRHAIGGFYAGAIAVGLSTGALVFIGAVFGRFSDPASLAAWFFHLKADWNAGWGEWLVSGPVLTATLARLAVWRVHPTPLTLAVAAAVPLAALGMIALALRASDSANPRRHAVPAALAVWAAGALVFGIYWNSTDPEFFLPIAPALWLAIASGLAPQRRRALALGLTGCLVAVLFALNLQAAIRDADPINNRALVCVQALGDHVRPGDLVIMPGNQWPAVYGPYLLQIEVVNLTHRARSPRVGVDGLREFVAEAFERVRRTGGTVYRMGAPDPADPGWRYLLSAPGRSASVDALLRTDVEPAFSIGTDVFYCIDPPAPTVVASTAGERGRPTGD